MESVIACCRSVLQIDEGHDVGAADLDGDEEGYGQEDGLEEHRGFGDGPADRCSDARGSDMHQIAHGHGDDYGEVSADKLRRN